MIAIENFTGCYWPKPAIRLELYSEAGVDPNQPVMSAV